MYNLVMLGIDTTKISRFKNVKKSFIERILSPEEIMEYNTCLKKQIFLAARWSIKEALYKADNTNKVFNNIYIQKSNGKYIYKGYNISTTNEGNYYISIVIKEK